MLITALFYRAWRARADLSIVCLPLLAGLIVGTLDEAWQWFVPERVGEWRDIFINFGAIGTGLLVSLAIAPPAAFTLGFTQGSWRRVCWLGAAAVLALAAFMHTVHFGYVVRDDEVGAFRSRYTAEELLAQGATRASAWRLTPPPMTLDRFSREDQYLAEALWHVRARNDAWSTDVGRAWSENRVLEKYFSPVLAITSYLTPDGVKWPDGQRADAQARAASAPRTPFVSKADPADFVLVWPRRAFWAAVLALILGLAVAARFPMRTRVTC